MSPCFSKEDLIPSEITVNVDFVDRNGVEVTLEKASTSTTLLALKTTIKETQGATFCGVKSRNKLVFEKLKCNVLKDKIII